MITATIKLDPRAPHLSFRVLLSGSYNGVAITGKSPIIHPGLDDLESVESKIFGFFTVNRADGSGDAVPFGVTREANRVAREAMIAQGAV